MAVDLLYHDGRDLTGRPLRGRRARLEDVAAGSELVFPVRRLAPDCLAAWEQVLEREAAPRRIIESHGAGAEATGRWRCGMAAIESGSPLRPGAKAPDFMLPLVNGEGHVSLARYRGTPLLLVINRGLWCSFCRRYIVQLGGVGKRLRDLGVDLLAIVASDLERARIYVRHRPILVPLAVDPERTTHRAYGLPMPPIPADIEEIAGRLQVELHRTAVTATDLAELRAAAGPAAPWAPETPESATRSPAQLPLWDFIYLQRRLYPYAMTENEQQEWNSHRTLGTGQFLIDRDGIVRWAKVQGTTQPPAGLGDFASEAELIAAARSLRP
jgi:peroxiredoxin